MSRFRFVVIATVLLLYTTIVFPVAAEGTTHAKSSFLALKTALYAYDGGPIQEIANGSDEEEVNFDIGSSNNSGSMYPSQTCGVANATDGTNNCCLAGEIENLSTNVRIGKGAAIVNWIKNTLINLFVKPFVYNWWDKSTSLIDETTVCTTGHPSPPESNMWEKGCVCIEEIVTSPLAQLCEPVDEGGGECHNCFNKGGHIWTGLGCVPTDFSSFIKETIFGTLVGIAGGISLLCIMYAAFQMQTSGGNAEKIKKAQQLLTNCITGLMIVIFSVLILKIIGVDILRIPGFSSN